MSEAIFAADTPASVGLDFDLIDVNNSQLIWHARFDETQEYLTNNFMKIFTFFKRGGKWITAEELAASGIGQSTRRIPHTVIIIPAIDLKGGSCVRLLQGRMDAETVFSNNPTAMALRWEACGAQIIHVVDLDGAIGKSPKNLSAIGDIVKRVSIPIQVGGRHQKHGKHRSIP